MYPTPQKGGCSTFLCEVFSGPSSLSWSSKPSSTTPRNRGGGSLGHRQQNHDTLALITGFIGSAISHYVFDPIIRCGTTDSLKGTLLARTIYSSHRMNPFETQVEAVIRRSEVLAVMRVLKSGANVRIGETVDYFIEPGVARSTLTSSTRQKPYRTVVEQWHLDAARGMLNELR